MPEHKFQLNELLHLLKDIEEELAGHGFNDFSNNRKMIINTVESIENVVEFTGKLPDEFKQIYQDVKWNYLLKLNEIIVNKDTGLNESALWNFCKHELVQIRKSVQNAI